MSNETVFVSVRHTVDLFVFWHKRWMDVLLLFQSLLTLYHRAVHPLIL